MPDFDIDFPSDTWIQVRDYCREKYGEDKFCGIVTFGTLAAKAVVKDVARVFRMPFNEVNVLTKGIDPKPIFDHDKLKFIFGVADPNLKMDSPEFQEKYESDLKCVNPELRQLYLENEDIKKIVDISIKLENMPRQSGQHAAGHIICKRTLMDNIPLCVNNGSDIMLTQFDKNEIEDLGFLKMDYLRINTLNDIREAKKIIKQTRNIDLDLYKVDYTDQKVFELISSGDTDAIFQLESGGFKKFMKELKPDCLEDIIAGVSLYRPGPMDFCPKYVENKHNPEKVTYDMPCLEPILKPTYGVIVYQEQVMQIVQAMAGYTLGRADNVRRMMGKKKMADMIKEREIFLHGLHATDSNGKSIDIDGAIKRGATEEIANKIFDQLISFASYAFNKSHAAAYTYLTFQTAYLKTYYPVEFLVAVLNNRLGKPDDLKKYISYAREKGIEVLPPSINKSGAYFTIEDGKIRHGLVALKNMGDAIANQIIQEREENGEFIDIVDLISRTNKYGLNKRGIESLILSGALDEFNKKRTQLMAVYEIISDRVARDRKSIANGQISMFDTLLKNEHSLTSVNYPNCPEYTDTEKLKKEKEIVGVYVSGHPLDKYFSLFESYNFNSSMIKPEQEDENGEMEDDEMLLQDNGLTDGSQITVGGIITEIKKTYTKKDNREMAIVHIEDIYGNIDCMAFPNAYQKLKSKLDVDKIATFHGKLALREGENPVVILENIVDIIEEKQTLKTEDVEPEKQKTLWLKFDTTNIELFNSVSSILENYKGNTEVKIRCEKQNITYAFTNKVNANNLLLYELATVINEKNIKLV